ncbi:MAG: DUF402 domain-containing protein [Gemmatimonadales bacterium]|nr:MAG: DUF402 domain-containing protein [Gemmatimonadales bacterium]
MARSRLARPDPGPRPPGGLAPGRHPLVGAGPPLPPGSRSGSPAAAGSRASPGRPARARRGRGPRRGRANRYPSALPPALPAGVPETLSEVVEVAGDAGSGGPGRWSGAPEIRIHYLRPPDRRTVYRQQLVHDDGRVKITLARNLPFEPPLRIQGQVALEQGSDAVWFTFPGAWHDIGRFHRADGTFTGIYANVITPCVFEPGGDWETTDLFLDLWFPALPPASAEPGPTSPPVPFLLDAEELNEAEAAGHLSPRLAQAARAEARDLLGRAAAGSWPPPIVHAWTRGRALRAVAGPGGG